MRYLSIRDSPAAKMIAIAVSIVIAVMPTAAIGFIGHLVRASGNAVLLSALGVYGISLGLAVCAGHYPLAHPRPSGPIRPRHAGPRAIQRSHDRTAQAMAVHRTVLVVDVEGFGDSQRTNADQLAVRAGLYRCLKTAFGRAGIWWEGCDREDRGDGVFILVPPGTAKELLVNALPRMLAEALLAHNAAHPPRERIRLRMALHAGEVNYDPHGVTAASVNLAFRLLDAPALKATLAASAGVLALIVSSWYFDEVVRHSPRCNPAAYRPVNVTVKETSTAAWIRLPDHPRSRRTENISRGRAPRTTPAAQEIPETASSQPPAHDRFHP